MTSAPSTTGRRPRHRSSPGITSCGSERAATPAGTSRSTPGTGRWSASAVMVRWSGPGGWRRSSSRTSRSRSGGSRSQIMLLSIQPDSPVPIYQQIRDRIVEAIAAGELPAGASLPYTRQRAVDLGVNFHTVNKGYDLLRQEGLLRIGRKSGAVVRRDAGSGQADPGWEGDWAARLRTLLAEAIAQGLGPDEIGERGRAAVAGFRMRFEEGA